MTKNTKNKGIMRFLIVQEKKNIFLGVCLDFNIIEEGKTFKEVKKNLEIASRLHLETVVHNRLSDDLLNRHAPRKYWVMYNAIQKNSVKKQPSNLPREAVISPYFKGIPAFALQ